MHGRGIALSTDLRERVIAAIDGGETWRRVTAQFDVSRQDIANWLKLREQTGGLEPRVHTGREHQLTSEDVETLVRCVLEDPHATNAQLAFVVHGKIRPRTVSDYLHRSQPPFVRKQVQDDEFDVGNTRLHQEVVEYWDTIMDIPWDRRVYMDESFVYTNEAPRFGRGPQGTPIVRQRPRHGHRLTIFQSIRQSGAVHPPIALEETAKDGVFLGYVRVHLAPLLKEGDVVLWDRLGRSGRCKNPSKQHYNPLAIQLIKERGATVIFLPPKGKPWNPIELYFHVFKDHVRETYPRTQAAQERRPRTVPELCEAVLDAHRRIPLTAYEGFFRARANGREFRRVYPGILPADTAPLPKT